MAEKVTKISQWGFVIITFVLLVYRITLHADTSDEIMNLSISYRIVLGDIPFYHVREVYQIGAIFMVPFVWLFVKLTGGTTGIILYSRVLYIIALVGCAILVYQMLKKYIRKDHAFFLSYIVVFFELFSMYYLWYDTMAVIFCLLGDLAIVKAVEIKKENKQKYLYLFAAGILHSCMAVVHVALIPMALGTAVFLFILLSVHYGRKFTHVLKCVGAYVSFPLTVILLAVAVILITGSFEMVLAYVESMLAARDINMSFLDVIIQVKDSFMVVNVYLVNLTKVLLIAYAACWFLPHLFPILAFGIIVFPIYNQYLLPATSVRGLPNYLAYIAMWAPLLYLLIKKKEKIDTCFFYIFWLPFPLSMMFIPYFSLMSMYGPIKAWMICLPAALVSLYYLLRLWKQMVSEDTVVVCNCLFAIVTLTLLWSGYKYVYLNEPLIEADNVRLTEGIFAGIKVNESMEYMPEMEKMVQNYIDGCETILVSQELRSIYLMTDLKPFTRTTEMATISDGTTRWWWQQVVYLNEIGGLPDVLFLVELDLVDPMILDLIRTNYKFVNREMAGENLIYIYRKNGV